MSDNILDSLDIRDREMIKEILNSEIEDVTELPKLCVSCKNAVICSVLPTLLGMNRIGISVEVSSCQFKSQLIPPKK